VEKMLCRDGNAAALDSEVFFQSKRIFGKDKF